jgi:hypothetical protein
VDYSSGGVTLYVGQLVQSTGDGVGPLGQASGALDTSSKKVPYGVVVATNAKNPTFNSTYKAESITSVSSQAAQAARDFFGPEGGWGKSEPQAMVQVALIDCCTVLEGSIFRGAYGTAVKTFAANTATADGSGVSYTAGGADAAAVADYTTIVGLTGANAGSIRIRTDATNSAATVAVCFPKGVASGDTFKSVNVRPRGLSKVQLDSVSTYIDSSASVASNYYGIDVLGLHLDVSGNERAVFKFNAAHLSAR